jgi:Flp pilus assembly pilin Flp
MPGLLPENETGGNLKQIAMKSVMVGARQPITDRGETTVVFLCEFWKDERGQDLIEYTLLMAFVALASAALFMGAGGKIKAIWTVANTQLTNANTAAQGGS